MVTPDDVTAILAQSITAADLELKQELSVYQRVRVSRVWAAGACFLHTRQINGSRRVHPFSFDLRSLSNEHPENLVDAVRRQLRQALKEFEDKLIGRNRSTAIQLATPIHGSSYIPPPPDARIPSGRVIRKLDKNKLKK